MNLEKSYEQKHVEAKAKGDVLVMSRILFRSFFPTEMWQEMEFYSSAGWFKSSLPQIFAILPIVSTNEHLPPQKKTQKKHN